MSDLTNTLARELEEMEDQRDAVTAMLANMETSNQETVPFQMVRRKINGEAPLLVWREHRGLTVEALAALAEVTEADVASIEAGAEPGLRLAAALAKALGIDAEDLRPWPQD
jgi:mRNA interferase RelE/StbE